MGTYYESQTNQMPVACQGSHAVKKYVPNKTQRRVGHKTQYVAHDPKLTIDGGEIASIHSQPIRFLGKLIFEDLKDQPIRQSVKVKLEDMLKAIEKFQLNGIMMNMGTYNNAKWLGNYHLQFPNYLWRKPGGYLPQVSEEMGRNKPMHHQHCSLSKQKEVWLAIKETHYIR